MTPPHARPWTRPLTLWLLGIGAALTVCMGAVASGNFRVTDPQTLRNAAEVFGTLSEGPERTQALRYVASELNRHFFAVYGVVSLVVFGAAWLAWFASEHRSRLVTVGLGFCVAFSLANLLYFIPTLTDIGRQIDFMPRDPKPPEVVRFYSVHGINVVLELVKLCVIAGVSLMLIIRPERTPRS